MSKSIADLRTSPRVGLPERVYSMCLASSLVAEVQVLLDELEAARAVTAAQTERDESVAKPKRLAQGSTTEIRKRLAAVRDEMVEHTGALTLRGVTNGAWREWADAHPARDENARDEEVAYGFCNADDLLADLGRYAYAWNGEPLGAGDWEFIAENAAPGDLKALTELVVQMHESVVNVPKLLRDSPAILGSESD